MKKSLLYLAFLASFAGMQSCKNASFEKTKSGLMYKIISDGKGELLKPGDFVKLHFTQTLRDSLLGGTENSIPAYVRVDSVEGDYSPMEILTMTRKGDSVIIIQLADTIATKSPMGMPPFMKKGDQVKISMRILEVFKDEASVEADRNEEVAKFKSNEIQVLKDYIASNNINANQAESGIFFEMLKEGTGATIDSGNYVSVLYKGTLLDGSVFDQNMDTVANPAAQPLNFTVGQNMTIEGFEAGIKMLKQGGRGKIYIPSSMGYGNRPVGPNGKGNDILIFEVEILDVKDKQPN
ncbi:MAG TPA: FKBP-type peptidyl-prolyl cis-trans isomerase [Parasegetibacter sp.]